jgi:hypothetical protein
MCVRLSVCPKPQRLVLAAFSFSAVKFNIRNQLRHLFILPSLSTSALIPHFAAVYPPVKIISHMHNAPTIHSRITKRDTSTLLQLALSTLEKVRFQLSQKKVSGMVHISNRISRPESVTEICGFGRAEMVT